MSDLDNHRMQIGYFNQYFRIRIKLRSNRTEYTPLWRYNRKKAEYIPLMTKMRILRLANVICTIVLLVGQLIRQEKWNYDVFNSKYVFNLHSQRFQWKNVQNSDDEICFPIRRSSCLSYLFSPNFYAKLTYGNRQIMKRGLKNLHLNIRSIRNKITDLRNIVEQKKPHIFGLSECELRRSNTFDEKQIKLPGYDILYPKSWSSHGYARVLVYIKSSLQYEQVLDLETEAVQSIWIKGVFKNTRKILFCHMYREHTCSLGSSLQDQRDNLESLLLQWEKASEVKTGNGATEIHIMGDMNLDALHGIWLKKSYSLYSLSKLVQTACAINSLTQLVSQPTRCQYNS